MSTARPERDRETGAPAGWVILLGLMVLALIIAWAAKGCGSDDNGTTGGTATTTTSTTGTTTSANAAQNVINEINQTITASGGIQFTTGSAVLATASKATLDQVASILSRNPTVRAQVNGHTDTQGEAPKNLTLSQNRAQAVVDYLVAKGIQATRLTARGFGETTPLVANETTDADRAKNRRVEFSLTT